MKYSTNHSSLRAKQRLGLSATKADRQFALALRYGKSADDFKSTAMPLAVPYALGTNRLRLSGYVPV